jgi:hypothetical protein
MKKLLVIAFVSLLTLGIGEFNNEASGDLPYEHSIKDSQS